MARRPGANQAEKSEATRRAILAAATKVVGREGYAGASIAKITRAANVAQGTFYYHFGSQQELFDRLLPALGEQLLQEIREAVAGIDDSLHREEIGFRVFFNFMLKTPEFYRVLNEAEIFAPVAYWSHMDNVADRYRRALTRSWDKGELPAFDQAELEPLTYLLSGAMFFATVRYVLREKQADRVPDAVVQTYLKLVSHGLRGVEGAPARRRRPAATTADRGSAESPALPTPAALAAAATVDGGALRFDLPGLRPLLFPNGRPNGRRLAELLNGLAEATVGKLQQDLGVLVPVSMSYDLLQHPSAEGELHCLARAYRQDEGWQSCTLALCASDPGEPLLVQARALYRLA